MKSIDSDMQDSLRSICDDYSLGSLQSCLPWSKWLANKNYVLTTSQGDFFIKEFRAYDEWSVENSLYVQRKLLEHDMLAAEIMLSKNGSAIFFKEEKRFLITKRIEWIHPSEPINDNVCFAVWCTLAQFHMCLDSLPNLGKNTIFHQFNKEELLRLLSISSENLWTLDEGLENKIRKIDLSRFRLFPSWIIHWDLHKENIIISDDSTQGKIWVLDFELTDSGPYIYDIARSMIDLCSNWTVMSNMKMDKFISGYISVRWLKIEELQELKESIFIAICSLLLWSLKKWFTAFSKKLFTLLKEQYGVNFR